MSENEKVLKAALKIIKDNLGDYTAELYKNFYIDKDTNTIISSVSELMTEFLGEENAKNVTQKLKIQL